MLDRTAGKRLDHLRSTRVYPERDQTLGFLPNAFKREVARPFKQLEGLVACWAQLVPSPLLSRTRLDGLARGVLHVSVDSSATHYELDRLLRGGLETELIKAHHGPALRRVKLTVDTSLAEPGGGTSAAG